MQVRDVVIMAAGAVLIGGIPTLALAWFGLWPHIPATLLALVGLAALVMKTSPIPAPIPAPPKTTPSSTMPSPATGLAQMAGYKSTSHGMGLLLGVLALIPVRIWSTGASRGEAAAPLGSNPAASADTGANTGAISGAHAQRAPDPISAIETDIDELSAVFRRNQIEGRQRFDNGPLKIHAEVVRVREAVGIGILVLTSPDSGEILEVGFTNRATPKLGAVMPGQRVVVTCPKASATMSSVVRSACHDVEVIK